MNQRPKYSLLPWLILLAFIVSCAASQRVKIGELQANTGKYNGKQILIKGEVVSTYGIPLINQSIVQVDDGTGKVWVKPHARVPFKGSKITVRGTVEIGLTIANKHFGVIVVEEEQKK